MNSTLTVVEMIEEQIRKEGLKPKPVSPLDAPVLAEAHTAIYKMHRYWARRPHNVFARLIEHYTNPGDLILDPFCGGGVTVVEALKLRRRVVGIDINPLATWITQVEVEPVDIDDLEEDFEKWFEWVKESVSPLFEAKCGKCGKTAQAEWYEWSNVVVCPGCGKDVVLAEAEKLKNAVYICTNKRCGAKFNPTGLEKRHDKMMWVKVVCDKCGETEIRKPKKSDLDLAKSIEAEESKIIKREKLFIPVDPFPDMNSVRENNLFEKGFIYFRDYFTPRQRIAIGRTRSWLEKYEGSDETYNSLLNVFTSSLRFTNKMVLRSEAWRGTNPLEWPGHMYWPPYSYLEVTSVMPIQRRMNSIVKGKEERESSICNYYNPVGKRQAWKDIQKKSTCWLLTKSGENVTLPDNSVDAIITDPPFGGNVQYLELSDFYLVWLKCLTTFGGLTDKSHEAIETRHHGFVGAKDRKHYEDLLYRVFKECRRVLKPDGWMVMTFHNRDIGVWMALHRAAQRAGFRMPSFEESPNRGMVYQPAIKNYTQTIQQKRSGSLLGDFILSFKPAEPQLELDAVHQELTLEEEKSLQKKAEEVIRYQGGVDEATLWTSLMPYLSETGILARVANFSLRQLLLSGPFSYVKSKKKWYMNDMFENGDLRPLDVIPAEQLTQELIYSHLREHKKASIDELLTVVYSKLVNAQLPQIANIDSVLQKYCKKIKVKGQKRDYYIWSPGRRSPQEEERIRSMQNDLGLEVPVALDHNGIIRIIAKQAISKGFDVHVGRTEQRKSPILSDLSLKLSGLELGLSPETFDIVKEIDILILKNNNIQAAIEVVTTLSTLNKAINDRFRNLLTIAPNLEITLFVVVRDEDVSSALSEIKKPANIKSGLAKRVNIVRISDFSSPDVISKFVNVS